MAGAAAYITEQLLLAVAAEPPADAGSYVVAALALRTVPATNATLDESILAHGVPLHTALAYVAAAGAVAAGLLADQGVRYAWGADVCAALVTAYFGG